MRIVLQLEANRTISQRDFSAKYFNAMNGFIYELLSKNDSLKELHLSNKFKGFCFSNLHKISNQKIIERYIKKVTAEIQQLIKEDV